MLDTFEHKFTHHRLIARCFIATSGGVRPRAVCLKTVVIVRSNLVEIRLFAEHRMVINDIHNDPQAVFMQSLYQLFQLSNPRCTVRRIRRIRTFGRIVIQRVVAPIVFFIAWVIDFRLVNREIIVKREDLNVRHAQFFYVVESRFYFRGPLSIKRSRLCQT